MAQLARLEFSNAEVTNLQKDISGILDYVGQVSAVGMNTVEELKPILRNVMREDKPYGEGVMVFGKREALIDALPKKEKSALGGFFNVVRKIIQKDE